MSSHNCNCPSCKKNRVEKVNELSRLRSELEHLVQEVKWKKEHGIGPDGEAWLTHRMEQDAKVSQLSWELEQVKKERDEWANRYNRLKGLAEEEIKSARSSVLSAQAKKEK